MTMNHEPSETRPQDVKGRFERIKEMIELPEENVSFSRDTTEANDSGLPLMLFFIMGMMAVVVGIMVIIFFGVGNTVVDLTLGNHFSK